MNGMILKLSQAPGAWNGLTAFDCSWLSRYKCESERLFCGGHWPINIKTVIIRRTNENFIDFIAPMRYFDALLNGAQYGTVSDIKIVSKEIEMLSELMKWKLGQEQKK
eukprot:78728_1